ncbi:MAG: hypothetical protein NWQ31_05160 [Polaribacter sp.]|nr:hypothetical protein [Polaribacter sp.]
MVTENKTPILYTDIIYGKVKMINDIKNIKEILLEQKNNIKFKVLISESEFHKFNFKVGEKYKIKSNKLLATITTNEKLIINGETVFISPNLALKKCIYFKEQEFCSTSIEIFEGLELVK